MDAITWLIAANIVVWAGIGGYVAFLAAKQRELANRIRQMESLSHDAQL